MRILENKIEESVSDEEWMKSGRWSGYMWLCKRGSILYRSCDRDRSIGQMKVKEEKKIVVNERVKCIIKSLLLLLHTTPSHLTCLVCWNLSASI